MRSGYTRSAPRQTRLPACFLQPLTLPLKVDHEVDLRLHVFLLLLLSHIGARVRVCGTWGVWMVGREGKTRRPRAPRTRVYSCHVQPLPPQKRDHLFPANSLFDRDHDVRRAGNIAQQEDIRPHGYALDSISNTIRASSIRGQDRARVGFDAMRKPRDIRVELWPEF